MSLKPRSRLGVRNAELKDVDAICDLTRRVYEETGMDGYSPKAIISQITIFPHGQFVITTDEAVIGYCATFIVVMIFIA